MYTKKSQIRSALTAIEEDQFSIRCAGIGGRSFSIGQQRTMEYNKNLFENGDLQKISEDGFMLVYNAGDNKTYLAELA